MKEAILTKEQLSSYIDECIAALNSDDVVKLSDLASLLQSISLVIDDEVFDALPQSIGSYANEFTRFKTLVIIPLLGEKERKNCKKCLDNAKEEGIKGLKILKKELCKSSKRNYRKILSAMAKFSKYGYLMYMMRNQFTAIPSHPKISEE